MTPSKGSKAPNLGIPAPTPVVACATPNIPYNDTAFTITLHHKQCYDVNEANCATTNNLVADQFASVQVTVETPTGMRTMQLH